MDCSSHGSLARKAAGMLSVSLVYGGEEGNELLAALIKPKPQGDSSLKRVASSSSKAPSPSESTWPNSSFGKKCGPSTFKYSLSRLSLLVGEFVESGKLPRHLHHNPWPSTDASTLKADLHGEAADVFDLLGLSAPALSAVTATVLLLAFFGRVTGRGPKAT